MHVKVFFKCIIFEIIFFLEKNYLNKVHIKKVKNPYSVNIKIDPIYGNCVLLCSILKG